MNGFREKLMRFMYGRYGFDQFGKFLFWLAFAFWVVCFFVRFTGLRYVYMVFYILNTAIYIYAIFRILSRNTSKRTMENEKYMLYRNRVMPVLAKKTEKIRDREHVYRKCPHCKANLRLARKRGKHITRCPQCGTQFNVRVWTDAPRNYNDVPPYGYR